MLKAPLPLAGLRVLAVEQYGAGPAGTLYLADLGAEVVKIENLRDGGDVGRHVGPHFFGPGDSQFFQTFNRNKRSVTLDLKHPEGKAAFHALVATADAVLDNLRGDLPEKLGLTYEHLKDANPGIVCAHLSAYGREGSRRSWPGYDYLMQAEAGHMSLTGEPGSPPARYGLSIVDLMTGLAAAFGLLAGVMSARATGRGMDVDTSLFDVALHNLNYPGTWFLNAGTVTGRTPRSALAQALGRPEWTTDPDFATFKARLANRERVTQMLDAALMERTTDEWIAHFAGAVPAAPVYDVAQALDNEFVAERGGIAEFTYPDGRTARMIAAPIRVPGTDLPTRAAPAMGADTEAELRAAGYSTERIAALRAAGVIA
jgi:succinate---hydroxymethylglutarate CoA-transferase